MIKCLMPSEANRAVHFMNRVFHKNFRKLLPKLYKDNSFTETHYAYKENKILGMIANIPVNFNFNNTTVKCKGIGMVSVSKRERGKGIMSKMVNHCIAINQEDTDMMFLTGNRQRYEHFGFVPAGQEYKFSIFKHNVNKIKIKNDYKFLPLKKNLQYLDKVKETFYSQKYKFERADDKFIDILNSWHNRTMVILKEGEYFGYLNATEFIWNIQEIFVNKEENLVEMLASLFTQKKMLLMYVILPIFQVKYVNYLEKLAENYAIRTNCNIKIVNYKSTIEKLLNLKAKNSKLLNGRMILEIGKINYLIEVIDNVAYVKTTVEEAKYKFSESEATTFLLAPKGVLSADELVNSYFPLSFSVPHLDNV